MWKLQHSSVLSFSKYSLSIYCVLVISLAFGDEAMEKNNKNSSKRKAEQDPHGAYLLEKSAESEHGMSAT